MLFEAGRKISQIVFVWQLPVEDEIGNFDKGGLLGQFFDRVTFNLEDTIFPVNKGN